MTRHVGTRWAEWVSEALDLMTQESERVSFELVPILTEQGAAYGVCLFAPGPVLGTIMHAVGVAPNIGGATKESVNNVVRGLCATLADERTKQAQITPSGTNGASPAGGGLIIPQ